MPFLDNAGIRRATLRSFPRAKAFGWLVNLFFQNSRNLSYTAPNPNELQTRRTNHERTLPEMCAEYDKGGGVRFKENFVIYTTAPLSPSLRSTITGRSSCPRLTAAAARILNTIPIYYNRHEVLEADLVSLLRPTNDQKPWWIMHAAMNKSHCIVGTNNVVETLLLVLRRPWCVLELCGTSLATLESLYAFATLASDINPKEYAAAIALLSHELSKKSGMESREKHGQKVSMQAIQSFCADIFTASENSYNGFWMRALCVCALWLDVSFSEMALRLLDQEKSSGALQPRISRPLHTLSTCSYPTGSDRRDPPLSWPNKGTAGDNFILCTYARVLCKLMCWEA